MELTVAQALKRAVKVHKEGNLQEAEKLYRAVLHVQPSNPDANHNLGVLAVSVNQGMLAIKLFENAVATNPKIEQYWLSYIDILSKEKQFDKLRLVLEKAKKQGVSEETLDIFNSNLKLGLSKNRTDLSAKKKSVLKKDKKPSLRGNIRNLKRLSQNNEMPLKNDLIVLLEHFNAGRYTEAEEMAESITKFFPAHQFAWKVLGLARRRSGRVAEALEAVKKAVVLGPNDAEAHNNLGITFQELGRFDEAESSLREAIKLRPDFAEAHNNLGNTLQELSRFDEAELSFREAIKLRPDFAEAHNNLGNTLQGLSRSDEAELSFREAIKLRPDFAEAHNNLGVILKDFSRFVEAELSLKEAIKFRLDFVEAFNNLGNTYNEIRRFEEAESNLREAIKLRPDFAEAYNNLGVTLKGVGKLDEAKSNLREAIKLRPDFAEAYNNLGITLKELGKLDESELSLRKAIKFKPNHAKAYNNLGITLNELGKLQEAEVVFRKAIKLQLDFVEAYSNLGATLQVLGRLPEAESSLNKAIKLKPDFAKAYNNLGTALHFMYRFVDALEVFDRALDLDPNMATAFQGKSSILAYMSNYEEVAQLSNKAIKFAKPDVLPLIWEDRLYTWIYHPDLSAEEICNEHIKWGDQHPLFCDRQFPSHDRSLNRRLKVGYVSPDFRGHTCRFYFAPLFSSHNHKDIELFAYSNVLVEDEHTNELKSYFDDWKNIRGLSDESVSDLILKDKIDILIDGCGHMKHNRLMVFARKPAPIQVTWLGAAWTTGLPQVDYALFDRHMAPDGSALSEKVVQLPQTWAAFRPGTRALKSSVKSLPALENGYVTFGYSGRSERLNHRVFKVWGRILKRLPEARLVLDYKSFFDSKNQNYFYKFLQSYGIENSRLVLRSSENIFEALGDIDITLDSFPHSGGTMLFDALWMGVPAVTLASGRPVGRIGTSLMNNLDLAEWVSESEQEYEDKAVMFAQDIQSLSKLRSTIRERMKNSPVMDEASFARNVETVYREMWCRWVASN